ncbi:MAG: 50S ribosomal protein L23 [Firmicutes bacterium]|nr:50S ribosomal protein L23 [Bacillota bacterium]
MNSYDLLKRPVLTEKSYKGIADKRYSFIVDKHATKTQIKAAVEEIFGVSVRSVNTMNCRGKLKRQGRYEGYTPDYKKAIIQLTEESKSIQLFDSLS